MADQDMRELNGLAFTVVQLIRAGKLDRHVGALMFACRERQAQLQRETKPDTQEHR